MCVCVGGGGGGGGGGGAGDFFAHCYLCIKPFDLCRLRAR